VQLLMLAGESGLDALAMACELALETGSPSAALVMNELRHLITPTLPVTLVDLPDGIALTREPLANCHRYDTLRETSYVH
jgi:hypothetical protein